MNNVVRKIFIFFILICSFILFYGCINDTELTEENEVKYNTWSGTFTQDVVEVINVKKSDINVQEKATAFSSSLSFSSFALSSLSLSSFSLSSLALSSSSDSSSSSSSSSSASAYGTIEYIKLYDDGSVKAKWIINGSSVVLNGSGNYTVSADGLTFNFLGTFAMAGKGGDIVYNFDISGTTITDEGTWDPEGGSASGDYEMTISLEDYSEDYTGTWEVTKN